MIKTSIQAKFITITLIPISITMRSERGDVLQDSKSEGVEDEEASRSSLGRKKEKERNQTKGKQMFYNKLEYCYLHTLASRRNLAPPSNSLPRILVGVLRKLEGLQRENQKQGILLEEYEESVRKTFAVYGEQNPPSIKEERERLGFCDGNEEKNGDMSLEPRSSDAPVSSWFDNLLEDLWEKLEQGRPTLQRCHAALHTRTEVDEKDASQIALKRLSELEQTTFPFHPTSGSHNCETAHQRIATLLRSGADWITVSTQLLTEKERREQELQKQQFDSLEKLLNERISGLEQGIRELETTNNKDVRDIMKSALCNSRDSVGQEIVPELASRIIELWQRVESLHFQLCDTAMGAIHHRHDDEVKIYQTRLEALEHESRQAGKMLSHFLISASIGSLSGAQIGFHEQGLEGTPCGVELGKGSVQPLVANSIPSEKNSLLDSINALQQRWKEVMEQHRTKEEGLRQKLRHWEKIQQVLEEHRKEMGEEEEEFKGDDAAGANLEESEGGGEPNKCSRTSIENEAESAHIPTLTASRSLVTSLPQNFTTEQLRAHLTSWRRHVFFLERQKIQFQCEFHSHKALSEKLTKQVASHKKTLEACSSLLLDIGPHLGLEDDIELLLLRGEDSSTGKRGKGKESGSRVLSGSCLVEALRFVAKRLEQGGGNQVLPRDAAKPPVGLPPALPPLPPSHVRGGAKSVPSEKKGSEQDQEGFREAIKIILHRLLESGSRIKKTLFALGTDETVEDDLLNELTHVFSTEGEGRTSKPKQSGENKGEGPKEEAEEDQEDTMERQLAALLQKYGRWTRRLEDTVQDHLVAQQRYTKYFSAVLRYFDHLHEPTGVPSTGKEVELLHRVAASIGEQPLDNLIDIDCVLLDGMEVLLPILETKLRDTRASVERHEDHGENEKIDSTRPNQGEQQSKKGLEGEFSLGQEMELPYEGPNEEQERKKKTNDTIEDDTEENSRRSASVMSSDITEVGNTPSENTLPYDTRFAKLYGEMQDIYRLVSGLRHVGYFVLPTGASRTPRPPSHVHSTSPEERGDRFIDAPLEDLMVSTPRSSRSGNAPPEEDTTGDAEDAAAKEKSAIASIREANHRTFFRVLSHNLRQLQQQLRDLSFAFKECAILVRRDVDALQQQLANMLADWSTVDVEDTFGQDRGILRTLHRVLTEQGTVEKGCYVLARRPPPGLLEDPLGDGAPWRHPRTLSASSSISSTPLPPAGPAVWQPALEMLADGMHQMIALLARQAGGGDVLSELTDVGAMYVSWVERAQWGETLPPLPSAVLQQCIREETVAPSSVTEEAHEGLEGEEEEEQRPSRSSQGGKVSHFSSPDALPLVFTHMFQVVREAWDKLQPVSPAAVPPPTSADAETALVSTPRQPSRHSEGRQRSTSPRLSGSASRTAAHRSGKGGKSPPYRMLQTTTGLCVPIPPTDDTFLFPAQRTKEAAAPHVSRSPFQETLRTGHTTAPTATASWRGHEPVSLSPPSDSMTGDDTSRRHGLTSPHRVWDGERSTTNRYADPRLRRLEDQVEALQRERDLAQSEAAVLRARCRELEHHQQQTSTPGQGPSALHPRPLPATSGAGKLRGKRGSQQPDPPGESSVPPCAPATRAAGVPRGSGGTRAADPRKGPERPAPVPQGPADLPSREPDDPVNDGAPDWRPEEEAGASRAALREVLAYLQETLHPDLAPDPSVHNEPAAGTSEGQPWGWRKEGRPTAESRATSVSAVPPPATKTKADTRPRMMGPTTMHTMSTASSRLRAAEAAKARASRAGSSSMGRGEKEEMERHRQFTAHSSSNNGTTRQPPPPPAAVRHGLLPTPGPSSSLGTLNAGAEEERGRTSAGRCAPPPNEAAEEEARVRDRLREVYGIPMGRGRPTAAPARDRRIDAEEAFAPPAGGEWETARGLDWGHPRDLGAVPPGYLPQRGGTERVSAEGGSRRRSAALAPDETRRGGWTTTGTTCYRRGHRSRSGEALKGRGYGPYSDDDAEDGFIPEDIGAGLGGYEWESDRVHFAGPEEAEEGAAAPSGYLFGTRSSRLRYAQHHPVPLPPADPCDSAGATARRQRSQSCRTAPSQRSPSLPCAPPGPGGRRSTQPSPRGPRRLFPIVSPRPETSRTSRQGEAHAAAAQREIDQRRVWVPREEPRLSDSRARSGSADHRRSPSTHGPQRLSTPSPRGAGESRERHWSREGPGAAAGAFAQATAFPAAVRSPTTTGRQRSSSEPDRREGDHQGAGGSGREEKPGQNGGGYAASFASRSGFPAAASRRPRHSQAPTNAAELVQQMQRDGAKEHREKKNKAQEFIAAAPKRPRGSSSSMGNGPGEIDDKTGSCMQQLAQLVEAYNRSHDLLSEATIRKNTSKKKGTTTEGLPNPAALRRAHQVHKPLRGPSGPTRASGEGEVGRQSGSDGNNRMASSLLKEGGNKRFKALSFPLPSLPLASFSHPKNETPPFHPP
eukprot:gene7710-5409_t